jgi:hypothetical protein
MTPPVARLAFLSFPSPGVVHLNLQVEGEDTRVELTRNQLRNIIMDGTAMAWRENNDAKVTA